MKLDASRIVCLVPSLTELLFDLELEKNVVGVTKFCVHPANFLQEKKIVGGTKNVNIDIVKALNPTLVIAAKEENIKEQVEAIENFSQVIVANISDVKSALKFILQMGEQLEVMEKAMTVVKNILDQFEALPLRDAMPSALYLIWKKPYMLAGADTFISSMMLRASFENLCKDTRYPTIELQKIIEIQPAYLLLSSEPYPFKQSDAEELQQQLPHTKVLLVDGEMFSWYGSRMQYAANYFSTLQLH